MGYGVKQRVCGSLSYCKNKCIYIAYIYLSESQGVKMSEKVQLKGGVCEFDFGYNANTAIYTNLSSDIPELGDILLGGLGG
jgi:hypothetical protein